MVQSIDVGNNISLYKDANVFPGGHNARRETMTTFLDFNETECGLMSLFYSVFSILGTMVNLTVAVVLISKMRSVVPRSPSDLLIVALAIICLLACAALFPIEAFNCNHNNSDFVFWFTFFLELSSTIAMLSIAVNR